MRFITKKDLLIIFSPDSKPVVHARVSRENARWPFDA